MIKAGITVFTLFLASGIVTPVAYAQDDSTSENTQLRINWTELELNLAPLEEVTIPEPQLSTGSHGERQTYLQVGEAAPWAGVLLNPAAVAYIIAEFEATQERGHAALRLQRESDWNRLRLEVEQLRLRIESDRQFADNVIAGQNREIERLQQIHEDYVEDLTGGFWNTTFGEIVKWGLVILGSGAVGAVVGYLVANLN